MLERLAFKWNWLFKIIHDKWCDDSGCEYEQHLDDEWRKK